MGAGEVTAGDVADLVGEDPDDLAGTLAGQQEPGEDEDFLAAGDECVELICAHQMDLDRLGAEAGRAEQWCRIAANGIFDFGVADDRELLRRRRVGQSGEGKRQHDGAWAEYVVAESHAFSNPRPT